MSSMKSLQNTDTTASPATETVRVQGVCYRNWTVDNAEELGLKGWVRNSRDGSVEALFSGSPDKVKDMVRRCTIGPPAAKFSSLGVFPCTDDPGTTFEYKFTVQIK